MSTDDITQAEMERAMGGRVNWPNCLIKRMALACYLEDRLAAIIEPARLRMAWLMGSFGNADTDAKFQQASRSLADLNSRHLAVGAPTGTEGVLHILRGNHPVDRRDYYFHGETPI